ncbi:hypothetical protein B0J12DRAFT_753282 [Macrophomina phaseolina]|uniref:Metallo-beta-lactamase domain-containing protein n=1 Tax=Macrophomina phaseolina TaxID=35725 RepID=A0ABQ8GAA9_9PEZI|nr:hypothetical protein B0J12DRAFT_753282 [Macrophomina phaseolina]
MSVPTDLRIPVSNGTVQVSIIDTEARIRLPLSGFTQPQIEGHTHLDAPTYSFLIEHPRHGKNSLRYGHTQRLAEPCARDKTQKDVIDVLEEHGIDAAEIKSVIWSHWHCDHVGNTTRLPISTELVIGAGFLQTMTPGYPTNPSSLFLESDYKGREVREIDFSTHPNSLKIGAFSAVDFFGDGSFYLLSTPGHAIGHICGLARITPNSFILTDRDASHHSGELQPSPFLPLPDSVEPSPYSSPPFQLGTFCPGALIQEMAHPLRSRTKPFYELAPTGMPTFELETAQKTVEELGEFDGDDNVFVVIAHDAKLKEVVDFFPKPANAWMDKGWKGMSSCRFLADFAGAVRSDDASQTLY